MRHAGRQGQLERRAATVAPAHADIRARRRAAQRQRAVRQAQLDRADHQRLTGLDGDRRLEAAELGMREGQLVATGVERGGERRHPELAAVDADARTGRRGRHTHLGEQRREGHSQCLLIAAAIDRELADPGLVARRLDAHRARAGGQLNLARQRAARRAVHRERGRQAARVEAHPPGQPLERHHEGLVRSAGDHHRQGRRRIALGRHRQHALARQHQVAATQAQVDQAAGEGDPRRLDLGNGPHLDRHGGEQQPENRERGHCRHTDGDAPQRQPPAAGQGARTSGRRRVVDHLDGDAVRSRVQRAVRLDLVQRRLGDVGDTRVLDPQRGEVARDVKPQTGAVDRDAIARLEGRPGLEPAARAAQVGTRQRFNCEAPVDPRQPRPQLARRAARQHHVGAAAAEAERKVGRRERPLAERVDQAQACRRQAQMASSQRMVTGASGPPGATTISRRTSRNPRRVPTSA